VVIPGSATAGEKEVRENLGFRESLRWTRSCPRTGGVLYAGGQYSAQMPGIIGEFGQLVGTLFLGALRVSSALVQDDVGYIALVVLDELHFRVDDFQEEFSF
jgi:hypothetical protein